MTACSRLPGKRPGLGEENKAVYEWIHLWCLPGWDSGAGDPAIPAGAYSYRGSLFPFSSVQSLSCVRLFETLWIAAYQACLSITNSWSPPKLMSIESVMPSSHLIFCHPLLLLPLIPSSIRVSSNESTLRMRCEVSTSTSVLPINTQDWSPLGWTGCIFLQSKGLSGVFSNTTVQKHPFFGAQLSSQSNSLIHTWPLEKP